MLELEQIEQEIINLPKNEQLLLLSNITQRLYSEINKTKAESKYEEKIKKLKNAISDKLFLQDLNEIEHDFRHTDAESW